MSTVPETIVSLHAGRRVIGFSLITNKATDDVATGATHEEVIEVTRRAAADFERLMEELVRSL
ncbi:MAG: purine-nucleoside phosphorylase, partial [Gemmatimonadota bacterium]